MRVLLVHNFYSMPGGEDRVFTSESELLESRGHEVVQFTVHNNQTAELGRLRLARATVWNREVHGQLRALCRRTRPDVAHFHNTLPLISPAGYYAVAAEGAAVVQTLHNYRLLCPGVNLYREGKVCEECVGRLPLPGIAHGCYKGSRAATAAVAGMLITHRAMGTWTRAVDRYIALTEFARAKFVRAGIPADKVVVKPNFVAADPGVGAHAGGYALFVGRLSPEKGIQTLLDAWALLGGVIPLKVVGDGPLQARVREAAGGVQWVGEQSSDRVAQLMRDATFLVFPSECYETFGLTMIEAFSAGLPVIATDHGSAAELVQEGETGLHFQHGNPNDLVAKVLWALGHPEELAAMGKRAREAFEARYTADRNYEMLLDVYEAAARRGPRPVATV